MRLIPFSNGVYVNIDQIAIVRPFDNPDEPGLTEVLMSNGTSLYVPDDDPLLVGMADTLGFDTTYPVP